VKGYKELSLLDATDLAKLIRKKEIQPGELIEITIDGLKR